LAQLFVAFRFMTTRSGQESYISKCVGPPTSCNLKRTEGKKLECITLLGLPPLSTFLFLLKLPFPASSQFSWESGGVVSSTPTASRHIFVNVEVKKLEYFWLLNASNQMKYYEEKM